MGCYGLGISRAMGAVVETNHDEKGIIWPQSVSPFDVHLISIGESDKVRRTTKKIYEDLSRYARSGEAGQKEKMDVLYDDREGVSAGEKFAEADLLGIPMRAVVSEKTVAQNSVELKERGKQSAKLVKIKELAKLLNK